MATAISNTKILAAWNKANTQPPLSNAIAVLELFIRIREKDFIRSKPNLALATAAKDKLTKTLEQYDPENKPACLTQFKELVSYFENKAKKIENPHEQSRLNHIFKYFIEQFIAHRDQLQKTVTQDAATQETISSLRYSNDVLKMRALLANDDKDQTIAKLQQELAAAQLNTQKLQAKVVKKSQILEKVQKQLTAKNAIDQKKIDTTIYQKAKAYDGQAEQISKLQVVNDTLQGTNSQLERRIEMLTTTLGEKDKQMEFLAQEAEQHKKQNIAFRDFFSWLKTTLGETFNQHYTKYKATKGKTSSPEEENKGGGLLSWIFGASTSKGKPSIATSADQLIAMKFQ